MQCKECGMVMPTEIDVVHECDLDIVREHERAKWARILRESASTMRRWAGELRADPDPEAQEAADINEREATVWQCIADVIEGNNESPCQETSASGT